MSRTRLIIWSIITALSAYGFLSRLEEYQRTGKLYVANTEGKMHLSGNMAEASLFALFVVFIVLLIGLVIEFYKKLNQQKQ